MFDIGFENNYEHIVFVDEHGNQPAPCTEKTWRYCLGNAIFEILDRSEMLERKCCLEDVAQEMMYRTGVKHC